MQQPHSYAQRRPYDRGRRFYDEISRKHDPVDPHSLEQKKLLYVLDVSPRAAVALLDHADGDIFKLMGRDYYPLTKLDGVGEKTIERIKALHALALDFRGERRTSHRQALNALGFEERATSALLDRGAGDLWAAARVDGDDLLVLDYVGPATLARLYAVCALITQHVEAQPVAA